MRKLFAAVLFASLSVSAQRIRKEHPRLIALDVDLVRIRALIQNEPEAKSIYNRLRADAETILTAPPIEYKLIGPRLLTQSRRALDRIYTLALLYRLDHDPRYLRRAVKELRAAADFPDWNPSHFLDTAEMTHAFAIGYDWLYPSLSPDERAWIRKAIVEKGLNAALPIYEKHLSWTTVKHNWNIVCNSGITIGALAVGEDEPVLLDRILQYSTASMPIAMASYAPDGGWAEGPGYWHYATRYAVYLMASLETAMESDYGLSSAKGFEHAGHFRIYFSGPSNHTFNYADSPATVEPAPEMFWLGQHFHQPVYNWQQRELLRSGKKPEALDLVWFQREAISPELAGWPRNAVFRGVDVAFLRSGWDQQALFLGIKGGDNRANHSQLDLGTFVLDDLGVRWGMDLGGDDYNLPGYFGKQRWSYFRMRTEAHNTLTFDGRNQNPEAKAPIRSFDAKSGRVSFDLTQANGPHWIRTASLAGSALLLDDAVTAEHPVELTWGMVTDAEVRLVDDTHAELRKAGKLLVLTIQSPVDGLWSTASTAAAAPQNSNTGTRRLVIHLKPETSSHILVRIEPGAEPKSAIAGY